MASPLRKAQYIWYLALIGLALSVTIVASTLPGCPETCGNVPIPYPFGSRPGCYRSGFDITCNDTTTPPKAYYSSTNIEVTDIDITSAEVHSLNFIGYYCSNQTTWVNYSNPSSNVIGTPFLFSNTRNRFVAIGCYTLAFIAGQGDSPYQSGCVSVCDGLNSTTGNGGMCNGLGCCETTVPAGLNYYNMTWGFNENKARSFNPCSYAALMRENWYNFSVEDLKAGFGFFERNKANVPIVLDWAIRENGTCLESHVESSIKPACVANRSICDNTTNGEGYICKCLQGYEGNPYLPAGCTDIDECKHPDIYPCMGICTNTEGSYECTCPSGTHGNATIINCFKIPLISPALALVLVALGAGIATLVVICFLVFVFRWVVEKVYKRKPIVSELLQNDGQSTPGVQ